MDDPHGPPPDPDAAPMHHEIKEQFASADIMICLALGLVAIVAGTVFGIIFVNNQG